MKIIKRYMIGRFRHKTKGNTVNLYSGRTDAGWDVEYYYYRGKKILTSYSEWAEIFNYESQQQ